MNKKMETSKGMGEGHKTGLIDEKFRQQDKPKANSSATAVLKHRDEDVAAPDFAEKGTLKGFDRDQQALGLGLEGGDLDNERS